MKAKEVLISMDYIFIIYVKNDSISIYTCICTARLSKYPVKQFMYVFTCKTNVYWNVAHINV